MRAAFVIGVLAAGISASSLGSGCGSGGPSTTATGGGATTTTTTTTSAATTTTTTTATGGSAPASCAHATPITLGGSANGDLSPTGAVDYYAFSAKAGQAVHVHTVAQANGGQLDPAWIDTVVTLFDAKDEQIAENDDQVPAASKDSDLVTVLPADGTYCVRVEECWTWAMDPTSSCAGTAVKDHTTYTLGVDLLDPKQPGNVEGTGNAVPVPITYGTGGAGCPLSTLWGTFGATTDVDVFRAAVPQGCTPALPAGTRSLLLFYLLPAGPYADGSTTPAGNVFLADAADPAQAHIAAVSGADAQQEPLLLSPPVDLAKQYLFSIDPPPVALGSNPFYVVLHGAAASGYLETDEAGNDTLAGAESPPKDTGPGDRYHFEGDLATDADVDWWKVPAGTATMIDVSCSAQRAGSGVRGLAMEVVDASSPSVLIGAASETAFTDAYTTYQPIPAGVTEIAVLISASMPHDPTVTSSFYHCEIDLR